MRGLLDRFSVDLDFDLKREAHIEVLKNKLHAIFSKLCFTIKEQHKTALLFILRYDAKYSVRNTLKISIVDDPPQSNIYEAVYLSEIDRYVNTHTVETMVANKLVAPIDRYEKHGTIAGRDIYDIHYFLSHGYGYRHAIIKERRNVEADVYIHQLIAFIRKNVTQKVIDQDLNTLLPKDVFTLVRKTLIYETLVLLSDSLKY